MITVGRAGMGPIITIMAHTITGASGGRMFMSSGITIMTGTSVILAIEGSRAVRLEVDFTEVADSTEGEDLLTVGAAATAEEAATAAAAMGDDDQWTIL
jgi:hypothetical protein